MNTVERIKKICKERKIPLSKMERELGFANGYISQLRKGTLPADRLMKIAEYLNEDYDYLLYGNLFKKYYSNEATSTLAQQMLTDKRLKALFHVQRNMDPERFNAFYEMLIKMYKAECPGDEYDFNDGESAE